MVYYERVLHYYFYTMAWKIKWPLNIINATYARRMMGRLDEILSTIQRLSNLTPFFRMTGQ